MRSPATPGDLLEGFYDDWALRERERLRMLYLDCLGTLLRRHSETGALEPALRCGRQILALDPLREDIHREVIRLHVRNGHRALALQQYESCRAALEEELGVEPMEETRALCAELLSAARIDAATERDPGTAREATNAAPPAARYGIAPTLRTPRPSWTRRATRSPTRCAWPNPIRSNAPAQPDGNESRR